MGHFTLFLLAVVLAVNFWVAVDFSGIIFSRSIAGIKPYSYLEDDYPDVLPIPYPGLPLVALTVEDSEHYVIEAPDGSTDGEAAIIDAEWESLFPTGDGFFRTGDVGREFTVSMFHQLHCLNNIRLALAGRPMVPQFHVEHCINYLRQMVLCASNTRLEPLSARLKEKSNATGVDGLGQTHICRDWGMVHQIFEDLNAAEGFKEGTRV